MIKVSQCQLCSNYFRTGKIRQILEKGLVFDADGRKAKFTESKMLVCKECYKRIVKGEGVAKVSDANDLFADYSSADYLDEPGYIPEPERKSTPEKKKRGRKPRTTTEPTSPVSSVEEDKPKSDRDLLKERIRERYNAQGSVIYSDLATEFNVDESLVAEICDEIDKEV